MADIHTTCRARLPLACGAVGVALLWCCGTLAAQETNSTDIRAKRGHAGSLLRGAEEVAKPEPAGGQSMSATDIPVIDVRVEGNRTIPTSQVLAQVQTRAGRAWDPALVQRDVKKLVSLPWFVDVQTFEETTTGGKIVVFRVSERPTLRYVEYLGNNEITDRNLGKETGLKIGDAIDPYMIEEGRRKIAELYQSNGFNSVQVQIIEGTKSTDRGVTYVINEGPRQKVWDTEFEGNSFASDGQLKSKVKSKHGFAYVFKGYVDQAELDDDVQRLTAYYRAFGFFQAKIGTPILEWNEDRTWATVRFVIHEGPRYNVRNVSIVGNRLFATTDLMAGLKLASDQPFEQAKLTGDVEWLKELYGSRGYVFTDIQAEPRFLEEPGQLDLVYSVQEGDRFRVGRVFVHIGGDNPHTKIQTALDRFTLRPGDIVDIREIRASERRLQASGLFLADGSKGIFPKITFEIPENAEDYLAEAPATTIRGQSPDVVPVAGAPNTYEVHRPYGDVPPEGMDVHLNFHGDQPVAVPMPNSPPVAPQAAGPIVHTVRKWPFGWGEDDEARGQSPEAATAGDPWRQASQQDFYGQPRVAQVPTNTYSNLPANAAASPYGGTLTGATGPQSAPVATAVQPAQYSETLPAPAAAPSMLAPPGQSPITPYAPMTSEDSIIAPPSVFNDPTVDINIDAQETQTGRFLLGVGVNSDAGVTGQIMLDEQNFDWRRPPTSWNDVWNGTAWRGGGQRLRLEAAPGTQVQRYSASWTDPYLFHTPVSLGLSASYFTRRYRDWDEERAGGRVSLGYQWTAGDVSARVTYRGESVEVFDATNPTLPEVAEVLGTNSLHGLRLTVTNDTRDNAFLPTQGHFLEGYVEGVTGDFSYPRGGIEARKYFLVRERADHTGRHVVSASTTVEFTGSNTPIYDRLYAGGFSTFRGYDFRGASPVKQGTQVGGDFMWINSVEYMFPITADDMLHGVTFCDFGTVEESVKIEDFRIAPGFGLRITVPAMGPAPIALDFAFPINSAPFDDEQVFSFSVGFLR